MPPRPVPAAPSPIASTPEWQALSQHQACMQGQRISDLFQDDPRRFENFSLSAAGLLLDYSKHLVSEQTLRLLVDLGRKARLLQAIDAMFAGEAVNTTEDRPALHVALRSPHKVSEEERQVHATLDRMAALVEQLHGGQWTGFSGKAIGDVVNIGIGGSDLGPAMVYEALAPWHVPGVRCHFVSNVDPSHLGRTLAGLNPETTIFIVASKSFTTLETSENARAARQWIASAAGSEASLSRHFLAVSANVEKAIDFGIAKENVFPMWDWVGGRFSLWSAIGLVIAAGIGMEAFRALLAGAHQMDEHFREAPLERNLPVLMGLLNVWYLSFFGAETQVALPYCQNLHLLPAFLQQLEMESLGKSVHIDGNPVTISTGGIVWGSAGTNGQHSFHQLLHQGTHLIPADFIAVANTGNDDDRHQHLLANCFAQSRALMLGKSLDEAEAEVAAAGQEVSAATLAAHKVIPGNKPSSTIMLESLNPESLGSLIAAYEHKVYTQSVVWRINAFDQWGVELGKVLSRGIYQAIINPASGEDFDGSTNGLINFCQRKNPLS